MTDGGGQRPGSWEAMPPAGEAGRAPQSDAQHEQVQALVARIHELERLTDLLSRGKYLWESTFDAIQDPVTIIDQQYHIQRANLATAGRAGLDIRKVIGKKCYETFAERQTPCERCPASEAVRREWPARAELGCQIRQRDYQVFAYPFPGAKGSPNAVVMHYRDVTEERRLQQEVVQQEKMAAIGMLAGGVAHEINNPLGGILAFTQLLMREFAKGSAVRSDLEEIERSALRCKKIVQDLLDFSRVTTGQERGEISLSQVFEKVLGFLKRELLSQNITVAVEIPETLPTVMGDTNRLQQVFLNVLTNAVHALPKGGAITITGMHDETHQRILLSIRDTGMGIRSDHLHKLFDPFFTTKEPGKGTGLGLAISYRIIRDHHGTIEVDSREGEGTTFRIGLPVANA
ncbi:MAG: PAS domain-containing protein [Deltaproteobacteria bacterium]|nr:PAS domain-containing protein [Deltaproteobacteria bacterium]